MVNLNLPLTQYFGKTIIKYIFLINNSKLLYLQQNLIMVTYV